MALLDVPQSCTKQSAFDGEKCVASMISWIQRSPDGTFSIEVAKAGSMKPG
jgi:hypothetical protein